MEFHRRAFLLPFLSWESAAINGDPRHSISIETQYPAAASEWSDMSLTEHTLISCLDVQSSSPSKTFHKCKLRKPSSTVWICNAHHNILCFEVTLVTRKNIHPLFCWRPDSLQIAFQFSCLDILNTQSQPYLIFVIFCTPSPFWGLKIVRQKSA